MENIMSRREIRSISITILVLTLLVVNVYSVSASYTQPVVNLGRGTSGTWANRINQEEYASVFANRPVDNTAAELMQFASSLQIGSDNQVTGIYVDDIMAYPVVQQPSGSAAYVSSDDGVLTQFSMSSSFGTVGILAHNFLAGVSFFDLVPDQDIFVVYGNGSTARYIVRQIRQFQAMQPNSPYSSFVDLNSNTTYSSTEVFYEVYGNQDNLVLQTCIAANGIDSWGRLFVIAERVY